MFRLAILVCAATTVVSTAAAIDLHDMWDQRCHECHGHAGDFARRHFKMSNGALVGPHRSGDALKRFMGRHEMQPENVEAIYAMLLAQAQTRPLFQQKCAGCHETAAQFARGSLVRRNGVLVGRTNAQPVAEFLQRHGKLAADEIPIVVETLLRVLYEVRGPQIK